MSDPVTNVDIEDVLSSIRRLVAEGDSPRAAPQPARSAPPAPQGKLVLTPALRVHDREEDTFDETSPEPEGPAMDEPEAAADAPEAGKPAATMPPDLEAPEPPEPRATVAPLVLKRSGSPTGPEGIAAEGGQSDEPAPAAAAPQDDLDVESRASMRSRLEATIAELEAAITERSEEWEPDGSESTPVIDWSSETVREMGLFSSIRGARIDQSAEYAVELADLEPEPEPDPEPEAQDAATAEHHAGFDTPEAEPASDAPLRFTRSNAAAFAAAAAATTDRAEPEPEPQADPAPQPEFAEQQEFRHRQDFMQEPEPAHEPATRPAPEAEAERRSPDAWLEDETVIDEATLRRLVAEIVREELQGELGERITRNVRKLVRREIYRVLATEDLA